MLCVVAVACAAGVVRAQAPAYPAKSIRMVIALAPGGGVDTTGRFVGQRLEEKRGLWRRNGVRLGWRNGVRLG